MWDWVWIRSHFIFDPLGSIYNNKFSYIPGREFSKFVLDSIYVLPKKKKSSAYSSFRIGKLKTFPKRLNRFYFFKKSFSAVFMIIPNFEFTTELKTGLDIYQSNVNGSRNEVNQMKIQKILVKVIAPPPSVTSEHFQRS